MDKFFLVANKYLITEDAEGAPPATPDMGGGGAPPPMPDMGGGAPPATPDMGGGGAPNGGDGKSTEISNLKFTYYVALLCELYNTKLEGSEVRKQILLMQKYIGGTEKIDNIKKAKWIIDFITRHFISSVIRKGTKDKVKAMKDKFLNARKEHKKNPVNNIHVVTDQFLLELAKSMYSIVYINANANNMSLPELVYGEQKTMSVTFTNANSVFEEIVNNIDTSRVKVGDIE